MSRNTSGQKYNQLKDETSPYLLQHAANPVNWLPWGKEAFDLARSQDKPIFLSIGYSTCHWCHVMARECFADPEVARIMNQHLVCIKVDREERPDVDQLYMTACHLSGRPGGWPLSVFMTPQGRPFLITTVIPRDSDLHRTGMLDLVPKIWTAWQDHREKVLETGQNITSALSRQFTLHPGQLPRKNLPQMALDHFIRNFDDKHAGFGSRPKFPSPHNLLFLMDVHQKSNNDQAMLIAAKTLEAMRLGGLFDQVGFGFHRYSTDAKWLLPHFEKMLYDQAMLITAYARGYSLTRKELFRTTARETIEYCCRDLLSPEGGFYSAENADSEGEEGKFYVWTEEELKSLLGPEEFSLVRKVFNTKPEGNFQDEATGLLTGANVLHLARPLDRLALDLETDPEQLTRQMAAIRSKLFQARSTRVRPSRDEKILCDWNALMISALCCAARAFDSREYLDQAENTGRYLLEKMQDKDGNLLHSLRGVQSPVRGFLDDYAFMIRALIDLYQATDQAFYLDQAVRLNQVMLERFQDPASKALFLCEKGDPLIIARPVDAYDGALPSGNSMALHNLVFLGRTQGNEHLLEEAKNLARAFAGSLNQAPAGHAWFLAGIINMSWT